MLSTTIVACAGSIVSRLNPRAIADSNARNRILMEESSASGPRISSDGRPRPRLRRLQEAVLQAGLVDPAAEVPQAPDPEERVDRRVTFRCAAGPGDVDQHEGHTLDLGASGELPAPEHAEPGVVASDPEVLGGEDLPQAAGAPGRQDRGGTPVVIGDSVLADGL